MYVIMIITHAKFSGKFPFFVGCANKRIMLVGDTVNFNYWDYHAALSKEACIQRKLPMFQNICKKNVALETE